MANKPLKSIKFPGLSDTYTVPEVDDTLAVTGAAADAKKVGDEISDIKQDLNDVKVALGCTEPSTNLLDENAFESGYYSSGVWTESSSYKTSNYMSVSETQSIYLHRFNLNNGQPQDTSRYFSYIYWFDANGNYLNRTDTVSGTTVYSIYNGAKYARVMGTTSAINSDLSNNKGYYFGSEDTAVFVPFDSGGIPDYPNIIDLIKSDIININNKIGSETVSLENSIYTINTSHASYKFQKVVNVNENVNTWRLFRGDLVSNGQTFNMWNNSDAEGAIHIVDETDYISGYHGSEVMTAIHVFLDGIDVTAEASIPITVFNVLAFYVESDVYHCYQDSAVKDTIAFKRCKIIEFKGDKVTISNSYIAQDDFKVNSARIALFQCYKSNGTTPVFTDFSVNTDFKNYSVANVSDSIPTASADMTEAKLQTTFGNITFRSLLTSGQSYKGSVVNFSSQNRIKFYFDTISQNTDITSGTQIKSQFEFEIK